MPSLNEENFPRPVKRVEVAPGVMALPVDLRCLPALGVFEWVSKQVVFCDTNQRGTAYVPVWKKKEAWMRISEAEKLPFGPSSEVIMCLWRSGFIEGNQPAPSSAMINILSLLEHVEATRDDPDYWTAERRQRYRDANRPKRPARRKK